MRGSRRRKARGERWDLRVWRGEGGRKGGLEGVRTMEGCLGLRGGFGRVSGRASERGMLMVRRAMLRARGIHGE